ncbi:DmsC/YnfH family molybdoenzyme membrane anchor subunit [Schlesneria sp.]|uniref:DmsC/YnfH family molybdoenzyme membrane anchor subunit n=1 Tax=Schlesneria sp. TaxID=2762018 RepID=UPI002EED4028
MTTLQTRPLTLQDFHHDLSPVPAERPDGISLIAHLLQQQQELSAVEMFSREHRTDNRPAQARYYEKLLPATPPAAGQQYAFEVDLDRCSGCKACVTACHSLNGLDQNETWRDVGLLVGGTEFNPVMQHVTAACHHCVEPACMSACPVDAYEKNAETGIVKHLDDQCFGCQYCTLACPYNVPKYHQEKGIVRKCDMCSNRLSKGEAPACVQACPHEAIAIRVVSIQRVIEDSEANNFLPAAPDPSLTLPTTTYKTSRQFPRNMLPADYYSISPAHPHWPLILMLVLTQLSVGAFTIGFILDTTVGADLAAFFRPLHATSALILGLLALAASTCHLGRPLYAFRGILGWRHSWLSREIVLFGLFACLAVLYAVACWIDSQPSSTALPMARFVRPYLPILGGLVSSVGLSGVFCSVMIYVFTQRDLWNLEQTLIRFTLTTALLGTTTTLLSCLLMQWFVDVNIATGMLLGIGRSLVPLVIAFNLAKLLFDLALLRHRLSSRMTSLKRSALLVCGPLLPVAWARLSLGVLGGLALPLVLLHLLKKDGSVLAEPLIASTICLIWFGCLGAELFERYLFFAAVSSPRMPGGVRS